MAQLMVDYITSFDGYGAADDWPGLWGMGGPEYLDFLAKDSDSDYRLLMGATTFQMFRRFAEAGEDFIDDLTAHQKYVFSRTLTEPLGWDNSTLVKGDAVEAVRELKKEDVPLRTIGSNSLCRSLLRAGLVDRYRVVVFPVVTGATGKDRMYDGWPDVTFEVIESRTLDGRLQLFELAPTVLDGPPGPGSMTS